MDKLPRAAVKRMVDLSTAHITQKDSELLRERVGVRYPFPMPRIVEHDYGLLVFTREPEECVTEALREEGFSPAFIDIYERAACAKPVILLINFDQDGEEVDGLPTFDWDAVT